MEDILKQSRLELAAGLVVLIKGWAAQVARTKPPSPACC